MRNEADPQDHADSRAPVTRVDAKPKGTRRDFLGSVGKKALYVAPVILTLSASQTALAGSPYCLPSGAACTTDSECCSGDCRPTGMGAKQCL